MEDRSCTDIPWLLLFILFCVGMVSTLTLASPQLWLQGKDGEVRPSSVSMCVYVSHVFPTGGPTYHGGGLFPLLIQFCGTWYPSALLLSLICMKTEDKNEEASGSLSSFTQSFVGARSVLYVSLKSDLEGPLRILSTKSCSHTSLVAILGPVPSFPRDLTFL